jgi:hypothetical protein
LNATAVVPVKPLPVIVTCVPTGPLVGLKDVIAGELTMKFAVEVVLPPEFVTVIGPFVAPFGTTAVSRVSENT